MPESGTPSVERKLDAALRILALILTREMRQKEAIALLNRAGFQPKEIAQLLATTPGTVRQTLFAERKQKRGAN